MPRLRKTVPSDERPGHEHPKDTLAVLLEALDPERTRWLVELRVPDESLEGGAWYDCVELSLSDLSFDDDAAKDIKRAGQVTDGATLARDLREEDSKNHAPREKVAA